MPTSDSKSTLKTPGETPGDAAAPTRDATSYATTDELEALLERQGYKCALTGRDLDPSDMHVDHIVPVKHGGGSGIGNLQWLCKQANLAKGTLTVKEFLGLCQDVVKRAQGGA